LDLCNAEARLPIVPLTDPTKDKIQAAMRHAGLLN
jgi:4-hydroxy-tetrahydrodipicolinate synthase